MSEPKKQPKLPRPTDCPHCGADEFYRAYMKGRGVYCMSCEKPVKVEK
jgi:uncharacterized protein (DUF983 family)